jgi:DNA-binding LacI/PurR family transcriptional regulator
MAFGVLQSLRKKGLRVPEDISVIGYDNHEYSNVLGLTTIAQPVQFLGQLAATQIMAKIEKSESQLAQIKVPTNLVVRDSVAEIN